MERAESNSFEKKIWDAACVLRGNMDASEYKSVVLGLIFLKYISDRFDEKYRALVAEGSGFEEDIDEYASEGIFFVPASARWSVISAAAHTPEIGTVIDGAMRSIEKENKRLKDVLPKNFARPELDKRRLGEVVDLFTNIQMIEHGSERDILGGTYQYCLRKFAENEGKLAGEFFTPECVVKTLVEVLQPFNGRVYDPCCGSGGMFVQSAKFVENHAGNINDISVYGQDSNPTTWKMAQMNLAIRGIDADLGKYNADTFFNDCHPTLRADYIMANPPFNLSNWGADKLTGDVRWQYGMPPQSSPPLPGDFCSGILSAIVAAAIKKRARNAKCVQAQVWSGGIKNPCNTKGLQAARERFYPNVNSSVFSAFKRFSREVYFVP